MLITADETCLNGFFRKAIHHHRIVNSVRIIRKQLLMTYSNCRVTALQGVFRGLQDAKTPFYATLACNALNIALEPPFIFKPLNLGVQGSALATTLAQIVPLAALLLVLQRRYNLSFKGLDMAQLGAMFAPTGFLLLRTISISAVFAAATSLVARAGPLAAAAHQVG
jgi:MATE family multidrug resistance protein